MVDFLIKQKVIVGVIIIFIALIACIKPFSRKDYKSVVIILLIAGIMAAIAFSLDANGGWLGQLGNGIKDKTPTDLLE